MEIITNGWLLSGHRWELLKSLRISNIQVSVNAATDQTHQIAMGSKPGTFDRVVANIENILADPDWLNLPETSVSSRCQWWLLDTPCRKSRSFLISS